MLHIYIYIYIYNISSLKVNDLTLILQTWRKWWTPNNASKWQMGFNSAFKGLNWQERQFSRLLAAEVCASAVVMLDTPCSVIVRRVLAIRSIRQFPLHFPSRASPCAITFQMEFTYYYETERFYLALSTWVCPPVKISAAVLQSVTESHKLTLRLLMSYIYIYIYIYIWNTYSWCF